MKPKTSTPVDVGAVRRAHPLQDVIAAAGVHLTARGRGFIGCCPFHPDTTPSMSVNGVPDRFHCFGCGASGDVIEFVQRRYGLTFREAVDHLERAELVMVPPTSAVTGQRSEPQPTISRSRAYEINAMAWEIFADPVGARFARTYLQHHRGIDVSGLEASVGVPLAGRAGSGWTRVVDELGRRGVSQDELLTVDLAQHTRHGHVVDTLRNRLIIPVRDREGRINGFIGRDVTGDPRPPKYRNPSHTPVFDKALLLYRPTPTHPNPDGTVVVVEGPLDALSIAASAAAAGWSDRIIPVTACGTAVSPPQAAQVCALAPAEIVLALDGDQAGRTGTERWLDALTVQRHRLARIADLPEGADPADWLGTHGTPGLAAFGVTHANGTCPRPRMPGRELVRLSLPRARDPIRDTAHELLSIARHLQGTEAVQLLQQAEAEMSRQGWNPRGIFGHYLRAQATQDVRDRLHARETPRPRGPDSPSVLSL